MATMNDFHREITIGDKYRPAMEIVDQTEADAYFERCVQHTMNFGADRVEAERIERINLGYYAGYYDRETQERVNRLFRTVHPIFGAVRPTARQCFESGKKMAKTLTAEAAC